MGLPGSAPNLVKALAREAQVDEREAFVGLQQVATVLEHNAQRRQELNLEWLSLGHRADKGVDSLHLKTDRARRPQRASGNGAMDGRLIKTPGKRIDKFRLCVCDNLGPPLGTLHLGGKAELQRPQIPLLFHVLH